MKKTIAVLMALIMVLSLAACGSGKKAKWTVGVCQLVQHSALDKATEGFIDVLKEELGDDVEIIAQNASGDYGSCTTVVNDLMSRNIDLLMANNTIDMSKEISSQVDKIMDQSDKEHEEM
ncbi:MAG: hypothetical protein IJJ48_05615, partial [Firmicutes bacterium]|nr:hypothetical protein [Bacillota bacterium]